VGLILDSSVVIATERRGDSVKKFIRDVVDRTGDEVAALSAIGLTELVHGIYRAQSARAMNYRRSYVEDIRGALSVHPYTWETAELAGRIDGQQRALGNTIPFEDLLIGATALGLDFSLLTINPRDFRRIPGLRVIPF
jgi:tRNA(fMet)-specific endonuclease VapC